MTTSAIHFLSLRLAQSMARHTADENGVILPLPKFAKLAISAQQLARQFDPGNHPEPAAKLRKEAIARLRHDEDSLSSRDWKLISWGLSDPNENAPCLLDDTPEFSKIYRYVNQQISTKSLSRKLWFGLSFSYFAYSHKSPEMQPNWNSLQDQIRKSFHLLNQQQNRKHTWSLVVTDNFELFESNAGQQLGRAIFNGNSEVLKQVQEYLPIPAASWLWQRIINEQLAQLNAADDQNFSIRINSMLTLAQQHPKYQGDILAAILTRYAGAAFRDEPHRELKDYALSAWGSPQIKTTKNRWTVHVKDDVCKMVLRWFAKEDLEHFFKLLQGESGVDQRRLNYWLRFVDQMNYTRIVLGTDAKNDQSPDFVDFRQKNNARLSYLSGAPSKDSAFIMQIGEYYVVEFSGTGHASFIYSTPPFNPDAKALDLNKDLKQQSKATMRLRHAYNWEGVFDEALIKLGIASGSIFNNSSIAIPRSTSASLNTQRTASTTSDKINIPKNTPQVPPKLAVSQATLMRTAKTETAIEQAKLLLASHSIRIVTNDLRKKGGAFWILISEEKNELATQLRRLGFGFVPSKGFWIK